MVKRTRKTTPSTSSAIPPLEPVTTAATVTGRPVGEAIAPLPDADRAPRLPSVSVLERRLVDPDLRSSPPVRLKDPSMYLRWVNTTAYPGRYSVARTQQGWEPVRVEELEDANEIPELVTAPDGLVRRGDRGQEVLMKMPQVYHEKIQRRKVAVRTERERSSRKTKEAVAQAAAERFGPEAGDYIGRHIKGEVIETTERLEQP